MYEYLIIDYVDKVATVTVNRPEVMNALSMATIAELDGAIRELSDDDRVRVVVLTGASKNAFVAGADIKELESLTPAEAEAQARRGQAVFEALEQMGKPVIAAINGYALGGGCELAMACSMRIAAETAKIGLPEVTLGLLPGYGGTQRLSRLVGSGRALEIMLTGKPISADEAWRIGLVNRVVSAAELMPIVQTVAAQLATQAPIAMRHILTAVREGSGMTLSDGCAHEASLFGLAAATDDWREGTRAFIEKRRPCFSGS